MPRDPATGIYTRVSNSFSDPVLGEVIDPTNANVFWDDLTDALNDVPGQVITGGPPLFILATGQSNFVNSPALVWEPAENLVVWDNVLDSDGSVGTAFVAAPSTTVNAAHRQASVIAKANPSRQVYLLDVAFNSQAISHWLPAPSAPDIYNNILLNITGALTAAGATQVDVFLWWQGDADRASYQSYLANFDTVMARFEAETWFPVGTPKFVWGIANSSTGGDADFDKMNGVLQGTVAEKPFDRQFFNTGMFADSYWATNHMTASGYFLAGEAAANSFLSNAAENVLQNTIVATLTGNMGIATLPDTARLAIAKGASVTRVVPAPYTISDSREALVHVQGADGFSSIITNDAWGTGAIPWLASRAARGTSTTPTASQSGDYLAVLSGTGYGASAYSGPVGQVTIQAAENFTGTNNGTKFAVRLTPLTGVNATDRFVVLGNGNIGVYGSTSGNTLIAPAAVASGTWSLPATTDTFVGKATTDTFTNKSYDTAGAGNALRVNGTQLTAVAGTGNTVALDTSGSFSPVLAFGGASVGITYGTQTAEWVRVGERVDVWINIVLTSKGSSTGSATITGLPFTAASTAIGAFQMNSGAASVTTMTTANVVAAGTTVSLQRFAAGSVSNLVDTDLTNTSVIRVTISYRI